MRRIIIMIITFLGGLFFFCEFFFPRELGLTEVIPRMSVVLIIIAEFAIGLGIINLFRFHGINIIKKRKGWYNSFALLISIIVMFVFQVLVYYANTNAAIKQIQDFLFNYVYIPLDTTTFSLLAFFIASAAYRAFRVRSFEAALMMSIALIVMLGQIPLGQQLTSSLAATSSFRFENLREWIMGLWNVAAQRGISLAMLAGGLAFSLRIWLGLEQGSFFEQE